MENGYLSKFKDQLSKLKGEIERRLKGLEKPPEFGSEVADVEDQESQEFANRLSIAQVFKNRLVAIQSALTKFAKKKYGICENCGKEISPDVLALVPESKLCKDCKMSNR